MTTLNGRGNCGESTRRMVWIDYTCKPRPPRAGARSRTGKACTRSRPGDNGWNSGAEAPGGLLEKEQPAQVAPVGGYDGFTHRRVGHRRRSRRPSRSVWFFRPCPGCCALEARLQAIGTCSAEQGNFAYQGLLSDGQAIHIHPRGHRRARIVPAVPDPGMSPGRQRLGRQERLDPLP